MKKLGKNVYSGFSFVATIKFLGTFIGRIYGTVTRSLHFLGPDKLREISWMKDSIVAIICGIIVGWVFYKLDIAEKAQGKETRIPRMKFKNFGSAILFFSTLFFGFISLFAIREYNEKMSQISYMFRKTFWQYCSAEVPIWEILATSIIFGTILAIGFSTTPSQEKKEETEAKEE